MRPPLRTLVVVATLVIGITAGTAAGASKKTQTAVQAQATEFRVALSRTQIKPGTLRLELVNYGEDEHDLAVRRVGSSHVEQLELTQPGERSVARFKVRRGAYMLWCTIADHRARGMKTMLKVRTPKKAKKRS